MSLFAVISAPPLPPTGLEDAIGAKYAQGDWHKVTEFFWLVSDTGIAKDVSDKIGISDNPSLSAVVISFSGYYGRAANHIWEWIALKTTQKVTADGA